MNKPLLTLLVILSITFAALMFYRVNSLTVVQQPPPITPTKPPPVVVPPVPEVPVYTYDDGVNSITHEELKKNLYYLASDELEGRMSGKKGNVVAAEWIKKEFEKYGLKTMYHKFKIKRLNSGPKNEQGDDFTQNIYGWIEGNDPVLKNEIVVIGAHMDHIGWGPSMSRSRNRREIHNGADDNASGTVSILEVAQAFGMLKGKVKRTIVIQAYSAEEMGLIGSRFYCSNPVFPIGNPDIKKHVAMINLDMVGYLGKGVYFAGFHSGESSIDITKYINQLNNNYTFARRITSRGSGGSDHACFYNKRVPVAFLHTGGHSYYHTPDDTPDKINYDGLEKISKYCFELAWKIAQTDAPPRFNDASFKELPYTHDHGNPEIPFHSHKEEEHLHSHEE